MISRTVFVLMAFFMASTSANVFKTKTEEALDLGAKVVLVCEDAVSNSCFKSEEPTVTDQQITEHTETMLNLKYDEVFPDERRGLRGGERELQDCGGCTWGPYLCMIYGQCNTNRRQLKQIVGTEKTEGTLKKLLDDYSVQYSSGETGCLNSIECMLTWVVEE
uniref:Uncharacterized protein n=1 Tax=Amphora coffeiformis TaxID=265554 RepID=A0A7S3L5R5_9STRA|mmetsp:Transcript_2162/g.4734  ORF Transcript_2162/g.4734 Transcript_2162/m.4734 type:complete len:163 (-) Transcript_2162:144-632(-)